MELLAGQSDGGNAMNVAFICKRGCNRSGAMAVAYCCMLTGLPVLERARRTRKRYWPRPPPPGNHPTHGQCSTVLYFTGPTPPTHTAPY